MIGVRTATDADADAISAIAHEVQALHAEAQPTIFRPADDCTFPPATIRGLMATPGHRLFVATADGAIAGYAYAVVQVGERTPWHHPRTVVSLEQMGVARSRRGRGAGSALLAAVRTLAESSGAAEVRLNVWTFNREARDFYARHGFVPYTERLWLPITERGGAR